MDQRQRITDKFLGLKLVSLKTLSLSVKMTALVCLILALIVTIIVAQIPTDQEIKGCLTTKMYKVHLCPGGKDYVKLSQISTYLQKTVVLTEDSSFWTHQGFDLQEMQNSLKSNLEKGKYARGGSTITQQLAKNMFLTKDKTLPRKMFEAIITVRMEKALGKKEILERYLNVVQFGINLYGVKKAARYYFKKHPSELSLLESAFLTFMLPNPDIYSKSFYKKQLTPFAKKRLSTIIDRMYQYNRVTEDEYLVARSELDYFLTGHQPPVIDPALDEMLDEINEEEAPEDGGEFY